MSKRKMTEEINLKIENRLVFDLLNRYIEDDIQEKMEKVNCITDNAKDDLLNTYEMFCVLYKAFINGADELLPVLYDELKNMKVDLRFK